MMEPDEPAVDRRAQEGQAPPPDEVERLKARVPDRRARDDLERDLEDVARGNSWAW